MSALFEELCARYGVLPQYEDVWGRVRVSSRAARQAFLAAMGVASNSEEEIATSLRDVERSEWQRVLPPVQIVREPERPYRIMLTQPVGKDGGVYRWQLRHESGTEEEGEVVPATLEEAGRCQLDGQEFVRRALVLEPAIEAGYHRLRIEGPDGLAGEMSLIVAPAACYQSPAVQGTGRVWGFAAQLYGVRSERNWGIGDFGDLRRMLEFCAESGASTVLLNPLHALFPNVPERVSPYSPSSRTYFNVLYLDVEAIADFGECAQAQAMARTPKFQARLRAVRAEDKVDYRAVAEMKIAVLGRMYEHFRTHHLERGSDRAQAFRAFQAEHGESLRHQALFDALQEHFRAADDGVWGWPAWPQPYRDRHAPEVAAFCEAHIERVEFFEYLQWQATTQLAGAGTRSWELGLGVGIALDLAVGVAEDGAATWSRPELYAMDAYTGAPPDEINRIGQDWGLPPWIPHRLAAAAYEPFIEMLRANMRDAGALRLDHVMGLRRLFWVPRGGAQADGAYVAYPFDDLLGILALESQRNRCMVIGEDLGTVPDEVREALAPMGVLSTRLLYFERYDDGRLKPPEAYPRNAMAAVTTHDLPTLAGYWHGLDIELRDRLRLYPDDAARNEQVVLRSVDRAQLLVALEGAGVLPSGSRLQPVAFPEMTADLAAAVYTYLARAPSRLLLLTLEDAFGAREQPNLPGTTEPAYPCWRLRAPLNLEEWSGNDYLKGILQTLRRERPVVGVGAAAEGAVGEGVQSWIPRATYRLQLHRDFNLRAATALLPYLDDLGVSHCYLSPILKARRGSRHGYDITDHTSLNPEIANAEDVDRFAAALKRRGMGQIQDIVPNHMGIMGTDNGWWLDVLENGPASRFAGYFDIDWQPIAEGPAGQVLLPVLGGHYGAVLEAGELQLVFDAEEGAFSVRYAEHRFPVDPREYPRILGRGLDRLEARLGAEHAVLLEFQSLITAFGHLPARDDVTVEAVAERARDKEVHKRQLATLYANNADVAQFVEENIAAFNGAGAGESSFSLLHELLQAQAYRLAFWRAAADEINYRRFFDINDLAALRMDNPEVFEATHRLIKALLARGYANGLRIDHPDGLYAPKEYFERLQAMAAGLLAPSPGGVPASAKPLYLVVEKILAAHEHLPESWPVHGTTGYDFSAACGGLFVDGRGQGALTRAYQRFVRQRPDFDELLRANKRLIMEISLAGELHVLAAQLTRIAKRDRRTCDFTRNSLRKALADVVASFPVYRTYVADCEASPIDVRYVDWAVSVAKKRSGAPDNSIFDFVRDVLLTRHGEEKGEDFRAEVCAFAMKFQQYSGPVMAKAVEDTTFYQYNRLVSLNEVGDDPRSFGVSPAAFHHANQERARRWPHALLASSTHDSKRSEDMRARISVLSEMPEEWQNALTRWHKLNRPLRRRLGTEQAPSRNEEYLLYQTLLGVWPFDKPDDQGLAQLRERLETYMVKASREAKTHTSWLNPDTEYETAMLNFLRALLSPQPRHPFLRDFLPFQERIAWLGALSSLAQLMLKLTSPGVPDIYQGNELWNFSLVDPDNRRAVNYEARRAALREVKRMHAESGAARCAQSLLQALPDGRIKLYLTWKTLALRRELASLFRDGNYLPLQVQGRYADHACAFLRQADGEALAVMVPRLLRGLIGEPGHLPVGHAAWGDTWVELPDRRYGRWTDVLTEQTLEAGTLGEGFGIPLAKVFGIFPYALLHART